MKPGRTGRSIPRWRVVAIYAVLLTGLGVAIVVASVTGADRTAVATIAPRIAIASGPCAGTVEVTQSGAYVSLSGAVRGAVDAGRDGSLAGDVTCADASGRLRATVADGVLVGTIDGLPVTGRAVDADSAAVGTVKKRGGEETFGRLMLAIAIVILAARFCGAALGRIGQPRVMGEILAGIVLGPTLLGALVPEVSTFLFPPDIIPLLTAGADIGLAYYMFLVGLELDPQLLKGRVLQAAVISNASVALPLALGLLIAIPLYERVAPDTPFGAFALFMGVAMSITAFPVLARILLERRLLASPVGALALAGAAIDDVVAWSLLALASAVAAGGGFGHVAQIIGLAALFCLAMGTIVRRVLRRVAVVFDEAGHVPPLWISVVFVGVLLAAFAAQSLGVAAIFGAFVMGLVMPRNAGVSQSIAHRLDDFVGIVLLPLFFVVTGLKTEIGLLDRPELWLIAALIFVVAVAGKWLGAAVAARVVGLDRRTSAALGTLMNARGLTELIVLNVGLELGVISPALFAALVLMALATTFMTGPLLRLIDRRGEFLAPAETAGPDAHVPGSRVVLVAATDDRNVAQLVGLAVAVAGAGPPRIVRAVRVVEPASTPNVLGATNRRLADATAALERERPPAGGVNVEVAAFTSQDLGASIARLASADEVDLVLLDGRRPLLGGPLPGGAVGRVLAEAPSDVAVLVSRQQAAVELGADSVVVVPFGGVEHDWAALELAAWLAAAGGARVRLVGAQSGDGRDASRLLANAALVVQRLAGVSTEPFLAEPGSGGMVQATSGASLALIGMPEDWRSRGVGAERLEIADGASCPVLYVRRGRRPGALAPRDDLTRFAWSRVADA